MLNWPYFERSPLRELLDQALQEERRRGGGRGEPVPVNVWQEEGALVIEAQLPGVRSEDVDLQCTEGVLTLRARASFAEREYLHQELRSAEYVRQLALPADCHFDGAEAELENGLLRVRIPQVRPKAPEKIRIQVTRRAPTSTTIDAQPGDGYREIPPRAPRRRSKPE